MSGENAALIISIIALGGTIASIIRLYNYGEEVNSLREESQTRKWEALQWALSLFTVDDVEILGKYWTDSIFPNKKQNDEYLSALWRIENGLRLSLLAMKDKYLNKEIYAIANGVVLMRLLSVLDDSHNVPESVKHRELFDNPQIKLFLEEIREKIRNVVTLMDEQGV